MYLFTNIEYTQMKIELRVEKLQPLKTIRCAFFAEKFPRNLQQNGIAATLDKQHRSDVQLSERCRVSLGIMGPLSAPPGTSQTLLH